ncbi:nicotinate-nucleotide--dimethylbenzimidazole phosphoribosyltransferase [Variovorax sp. KBW07]|uniref:nicotinate-nucleotide--dimethylbenzimidazole phosphoribosyltransferase n=1 Tax=Variovorax sp. KBW07 TaxID=2153358 RepID=UPI0016251C11|nr:nicotinate-nucleotide--dimethylbenzimidazole phosphoribosyltransferase [Variovorax sp. KBW07]
MNNNEQISAIPDIVDTALVARLRSALDNKTKPLGALGRIETLALRIGLILGSEAPRLEAPQMLVCAGDHGLAARGVSAYPSDVTWQMVENFLAGGAAVSVLARQHGLALTVVDCGVVRDFQPRPGLVQRRIAAGTADASTGPAMTSEQCAQAIANGREVVRALPGNAVLLGEMGIGNSSSAALLLSRLAGLPIDACIGVGTGLDAAGLARKREVLRQVLALHASATAPLDALAAFGGFEVATLVGVVLQAAQERRVIVVDGFIASAAVLVAQALQPFVAQRCVAAHCSAEPGHVLLLERLGLEPLLSLDLRLGEGSGGALAWPLLESACLILREMASFEAAGVSRKT